MLGEASSERTLLPKARLLRTIHLPTNLLYSGKLLKTNKLTLTVSIFKRSPLLFSKFWCFSKMESQQWMAVAILSIVISLLFSKFWCYSKMESQQWMAVAILSIVISLLFSKFWCYSKMESQQWMAVAILSIVIFGCTGNIISFLLFSRPHMRSSSVNVLLCALSFVDFSLLLLSVPTFAIPGLDLWETHEGAIAFLAYVLKFVYPINLTMQTCSIYIMVTITIERWFAVCRPLQVRVWCTSKKSRNALLVIFLVSIAYNFVRFFEYDIVKNEAGHVEYIRLLRNQTEHPWYVVGYFTSLYLLTHFLVPFSIMAVMNGHVILSMWRMRRARQMMTRQQQREQSTTVMLLIVTFVFASCNTLPFLLNVAECIYSDLFIDDRTAPTAYQLNDLSNVLVVLNSATTFLVYISFSEKYRHTLIFIMKLAIFAFAFRHGCCATASDYNAYTAMSRTASMRVPSSNYAVQPKLSTSSRLSDSLLKPGYVPKRTVSEYNHRIVSHTDLKTGRIEKPRASERKRRKVSRLESIISSPTSNAQRNSTPEITVTTTEE